LTESQSVQIRQEVDTNKGEEKPGEVLLPYSVISCYEIGRRGEEREGRGGKKEKQGVKKTEGCLFTFFDSINIVDMTVAKLKEELTKRGVETTNKQRKADLQKLLKDAVKNNILGIGSGGGQDGD
jgi:HeH/LEM domain